jgi:hypothetical protein
MQSPWEVRNEAHENRCEVLTLSSVRKSRSSGAMPIRHRDVRKASVLTPVAFSLRCAAKLLYVANIQSALATSSPA